MIRKPFFRIANGNTRTHKETFFHNFRRNRCPAKTAMIKRAKVDRIPLHSSATRIETPGRVKIKPSLKTGIPEIRKNSAAALALCSCKNKIVRLSKGSGIGIMNTRNKNGKLASRNAFAPKNSANAPAHASTVASIATDSPFSTFPPHGFNFPRAKHAAAASRRELPTFHPEDSRENILCLSE